jgi:predicted ester cyclase
MPTEVNKDLIRRYFEEVWNRGNLTVVEELQDPQYVEHSKRFIPMWRRAFPDLHMTVDTLMAEGNMVVIGITSRGTHLGTLEGDLLPSWFPQPLSPTGKQVEYKGIFFYSIVAGKIQREGHWGILDWISLLQQLGFTLSLDEVGG